MFGGENDLPVPGDVLDWAHLRRMTLDDAGLADEVLGLFEAQADSAIGAMLARQSDLALIAHGLKGAARSIGAVGVADAAKGLEAALAARADPSDAIDALRRQIAAVHGVIHQHLNDTKRAGAVRTDSV